MPSKALNVIRGATGLGLPTLALAGTGPWGIAAAVGAAGLGAIFGANEPSQEELMQGRIDRLKKSIQERSKKTLEEGTAKITGATVGLAKSAAAGASRRMLSLGQASEAESAILPAQGRVTEQGINALRDFTLNTTENTNRALDQADSAMLGAPFDPTGLDYVDVIGPAMATYAQNQSMLDVLRNTAPTTTPAAKSSGSTTSESSNSVGAIRTIAPPVSEVNPIQAIQPLRRFSVPPRYAQPTYRSW